MINRFDIEDMCPEQIEEESQDDVKQVLDNLPGYVEFLTQWSFNVTRDE